MAGDKNIDVNFKTTADTSGADKIAAGLKQTGAEAERQLSVFQKYGLAATDALVELRDAVQNGVTEESTAAYGKAADAIKEYARQSKKAGEEATQLGEFNKELKELDKESATWERHLQTQEIRHRQLASAVSENASRMARFGGEVVTMGESIAKANPEFGASVVAIGAFTQEIGTAVSAIAGGFAAGGPIGAALAGLGYIVTGVFESIASNAEAAAARQMVLKDSAKELTEVFREMSDADEALQLQKDLAIAASSTASALDRETEAWNRKREAIEGTISAMERERRQAQAEGDAATDLKLAELDAGVGAFAGLDEVGKAKAREKILSDKRARDFKNDEKKAEATIGLKGQSADDLKAQEQAKIAELEKVRESGRSVLSSSDRKNKEDDLAKIKDKIVPNLDEQIAAVEGELAVVQQGTKFDLMTGSSDGRKGALSRFLNSDQVDQFEANMKRREGLIKQRQVENQKRTSLTTELRNDVDARKGASAETGVEVNSSEDLDQRATQLEQEVEQLRSEREAIRAEIATIKDERQSAGNVYDLRNRAETVRGTSRVSDMEAKAQAERDKEREERDKMQGKDRDSQGRDFERASREGATVAGEVSKEVRGDLTAKAQKALDLAVGATKDGTTPQEGDRVISIIEQLIAALNKQDKTPANDPKAQRLAQLEAEMRGVVSRLNKGDK